MKPKPVHFSYRNGVHFQPDDPEEMNLVSHAMTAGIVNLLRTMDIFREVPEELLVLNEHLLAEQFFSSGQTVVEKNEWGDSLYIIISGSVKVHDRDYTVAILNPGEIFGEMAFLDPGPRSMSVTAIKETRVINMANELMTEIFAAAPQVEQYIISLVVQRLRQQNLRSADDQKTENNSQKHLEDLLQRLTTGELNVLRLISEENSSRRIAELLSITPKSVDNYRSRICSKLGLDGSANSLLRFAITNKDVIMKG